MDWESWLRVAAQRPSDNEDSKRDRTESQVHAALDASEALRGRPWRVFTKGSYANNTNVRLNYDVDVAVEYHGFFYFDLEFELKGHDKSEVGVESSTDPYTRSDFKVDVREALESYFGRSAVSHGRIAYRIREGKTTLPADVVPCWEYRRYDRIERNGDPVVSIGSRIFPSTGAHVDNFPKIQVDNGIKKNNATGRRYKRMVRGLKKLQTRLVDQTLLEDELPSYLTECLVYNVPNDAFNHATYLADMRGVLAAIFNATLPSGDAEEWVEVHELQYLFKGARSWTLDEVHRMASRAWDHMGFEG